MKIRLISLFFIFILFLSSSFFSSGIQLKFNENNSLEKQNFDKKIQLLMKLAHMPSLSTCVIKNESVVWSKSYGYYDLKNKKLATQNTIYMVASISKMFTAIAIMQLWEQGLFDLDDDVNDYLPFELRNPHYPDVPITFRMLLAHQSSLGNPEFSLFFYFSLLGYPYDWFNEYLNPNGSIYNTRLWNDYKPGEKHTYSSIAYAILGYLVEQISGESYEKYCKDNIFIPLEMYNSSFYLSDFTIENIAIPYMWIAGLYVPLPITEIGNNPAGGLKTTTCDLSHFLTIHINGGMYKNVRILNESTIDLMQTIQYENGSDGFAWKFVESSDGKTYLIHGGIIPGYRSRVAIYPPDRIGIIYSSNQFFGTSAKEKYRIIGILQKIAYNQLEKLLFQKGYE